jgi:FkbM family methyltransferase
VADIFLAAAMRLGLVRLSPSERTIRLRGGVTLTYRMDAGDVRSLREVWLDRVYQLPSDAPRGTALDLGANIGMTSVFLHQRYGFRRVIAVEPDPRNADLARRNMAQNQVPGAVIVAAVGASDGSGYFQAAEQSQVGRLADEGEPVRVVSVRTLLQDLEAPADLVKMDIEGTEEEVLADGSWFDRVEGMIIEFHPDRNVNQDISPTVEARGWERVPGNRLGRYAMDYYRRRR